MLEKALGELFVGEVLKYDQLFRGLCGEGGSDPYGIVDASDRRFSFMPNIVRLK